MYGIKKYQDIKLAELENEKDLIGNEDFLIRKKKITEKACLCVGLANSALIENDIPMKGEKQGVVICPGPNLAFFDKVVSLADMVKHIYGETNILSDNNRPNVFINELKMYIDYFKNELEEFSNKLTIPQIKKWNTFKSNLLEGISYYENLFSRTEFFQKNIETIKIQLADYREKVSSIRIPELQS